MTHKLRWFFLLAEIFWSAVSLAQTPAKMPDWSTYVTNAAVKSGNASDPTVWTHPPVDGDWLGVSTGTTVVWDLQTSPQLGGIYVAGAVDAGQAPGHLAINAGTIFVGRGGLFKAGHCNPAGADTPLAADTLDIVLLDIAPDPVKDPGQFGTGFLVMGGMVDICGSENKDSWLTTSGCHKGDTMIVLVSIPNDWNPGDQLVVPGVYLSPVQDEVVTIQSVTANVVAISAPLAYDHVPGLQPQGQANILPIGNLTRRVTIRSANPNGWRGHCMFMQDMGMPSDVCVCHVAVKDCGRTLAAQPVTDPMVDANGVLVPGTAANPRARYSWHSHRQGQAANALQSWDGMAVWGFLKWAFDNHDSYVNATNLLAYNGQGACFATERGSEIGTYDTCLGVRTSGQPNELIGSGSEVLRVSDGDFGFQGNGVWLQGPGVTVNNCAFAGHAEAGFHCYFQGPVRSDTTGVLASYFDHTLLPSSFGSFSKGYCDTNGNPLIQFVPFFGVSNNVCFGSNIGYVVSWTGPISQAFSGPVVQSTITNPVTWNCKIGMDVGFTANTNFVSPLLTGPSFAAGSMGIRYNPGYNAGGLLSGTPQIAGFATGVQVCQSGIGMRNAYLANATDVLTTWGGIVGSTQPNSVTDLTGSTFGPANVANRVHVQLANPIFFYPAVDLSPFFWSNYVLLPDGQSQAYQAQQAPSFVPFPTNYYDPAEKIQVMPAAMIGQTNQQIFSQFGNCVAGIPAPAPIASGVIVGNGTVGPLSPIQQYWYCTNHYVGPGRGGAYILNARNAKTGATFTAPAPVALTPGWNALTYTIGGTPYLFMVLLVP